MKEFDPESLAAFNGREEGKPVYVAREGRVYDVSASKLWKGGTHMKRHQAGTDLSADFAAAPHGEEVFERVNQVGVLNKTAKREEARQLPTWLERVLARFPILVRHPHPMLVHFPIVFMLSVPGFTLLALLTGNLAFGTTALHCLIAALLITPLTIATGLFTWWLNYMAKSMREVMIKIWFSMALLAVAAVVFCWRVISPHILTESGLGHFVYLLLVCSLAPLVCLIGWFGAKLTFPLQKK